MRRSLESIHNESGKIVSGATKLCSIEKLLTELGWDTLQERRRKRKHIIFYKIINSLTPNYLSDLLPPLIGDNTPYSLRNANDIQSIRPRTCTNLFFNSFFTWAAPSEFVTYRLCEQRMVQASLRIRAVSPEPSLLAHTNSESRGTFRQKARSLPPLNGWACAVEIYHDGMLEDTNSLDGAHLYYQSFDSKGSKDAITVTAFLKKKQIPTQQK